MSVLYESTRGLSNAITGKEAVLQGISPDGGLFVSKELGAEKLDLNQVCQQSYAQTAAQVLSILLSEYTEEEIKECIDEAYGNTFASGEITPVVMAGEIPVLELFHGPTSAFKDVALTILPRLMSRSLKNQNKKALILTATSGDTGKAAMSGFQDVENTGICVFYPHQKVSAMQQRQMACQPGENVKVFAVEGNFDDAQSMVKKLFLDEQLKQELEKDGVVLSSANSINVGRLVPQIVYYFHAYKQLVKKGIIQPGDEVSFSVPTGNFGDVLAGYYAREMGLPVSKFYVASNANNVLTEFLTTGVYDRRRPFIQTISPSMDILISSNLERLLYYMSGKDQNKTAAWMKQLSEEGFYQIDEKMLKQIQQLFGCGSFDDEKTQEIICEVFNETGYVLDPHSAIAYGLAKEAKNNQENEGKNIPVVALATASPYKFPSEVLHALGIEEKDVWKALDQLSAVSKTDIPANLAALKQAKVLHDAVISIDDMKKNVLDAANEIFSDDTKKEKSK